MYFKLRKLLLLYILAFILYVMFTGSVMDLTQYKVGEYLFDILFYAPIVLWLYIEFTNSEYSFKAVIGSLKMQPSDWLKAVYAIVLLMLSMGLGIIIMSLLTNLNSEFLNSWMTLPEETYPTTISLIISGILSVIVAPVLEEIFFRGVLVRIFARRVSVVWALIFSSILFGLMHVDLFGAIIFGLLVGVVYIKTQKLILPILIHAANNFIVFILLLFSSNSSSASDEQAPLISGVMIAAVALIWIAWLFYTNWPSEWKLRDWSAPKIKA